jgi:hypothetical protein
MMTKPGCVNCRLLFAVWMALVAGCAESGGPATVDVTGTVRMGEKPVEGANVIFHPLEGTDTLASQTVTDAEGRFSMSTHVGSGNYEPGIVAGRYAVTIMKLDTAAIAGTAAPPRNLLPAEYSDPTSTAIKEQVVAGRENHFDFVLESAD